MSALALKEAVQHSSALSTQGVLERLFTLWFDGWVYNQIWEDPRVDLAALQLRPDSRLLTIASGGCNILNYLIQQPESITAVDLNRSHMQLTRLKLLAIEHLPTYDHFWRFFGCADDPSNVANYEEYIRPHMTAEQRAFWEGGPWLVRKLRGTRISYFGKNLYDYSSMGYLLRLLHRIARIRKIDTGAVLRARGAAERRAAFDSTLAPFFDHWSVKGLTKVPFIMHSLGIPPRQLEAIRKETKGELVKEYRARIEKLACDFPAEDNYFAWQALTRRYDRERRAAVPEYLKSENHAVLQASCSRVKTELGLLTTYLRAQPAESLDRFVFLDAQDWMTDRQIAELWTEVARVGRPGTRIIFRSGGAASPVEAALPAQLRERFVYEKELSLELFSQDRSAIYGGFHVYSKPA